MQCIAMIGVFPSRFHKNPKNNIEVYFPIVEKTFAVQLFTVSRFANQLIIAKHLQYSYLLHSFNK